MEMHETIVTLRNPSGTARAARCPWLSAEWSAYSVADWPSHPNTMASPILPANILLNAHKPIVIMK
ncbi:hypothetical protein P6P35_16075, partial [Clostridium perfringens]|nr:hypothetical protein [Clostridium perfringens]